jgi:hypothetical protein
VTATLKDALTKAVTAYPSSIDEHCGQVSKKNKLMVVVVVAMMVTAVKVEMGEMLVGLYFFMDDNLTNDVPHHLNITHQNII